MWLKILLHSVVSHVVPFLIALKVTGSAWIWPMLNLLVLQVVVDEASASVGTIGVAVYCG